MGGLCPVAPVIRIVARHLVKPSYHRQVNAEGGNVEKLGVLDHTNTPHVVIRMPFVYRHTIDFDAAASSLAISLAQLPLFAGRLVTDAEKNYAVRFNALGASLTSSTSNVSLEDLLPPELDSAAGGRQLPIPDLSPFYPDTPSTLLSYRNNASTPLLHAQITNLASGGSVLVIALPHIIADQSTVRTLLRTWSTEYNATAATALTKGIYFSDSGSSSPSIAAITSPQPLQLPGQRMTVDAFAVAPSVQTASTALDPYAAPSLPSGWTSSRFERRSWTFYPSVVTGLVSLAATGGLETVAYHVPAVRLAALKNEASAALDVARAQTAAAVSFPAFISTNDALAARIHQAVSQLACKANSSMELIVDLRQRLKPELSIPTLGNCSWSVPVAAAAAGDLGARAAAVRAAIEALDRDAVSTELRWLEEAGGQNGRYFPVVLKGTVEMLRPSGPLLLSHWAWGEEFADVRFGGAAPLWHQPWGQQGINALIPNSVFVVPAAAGLPGGGVAVFITLHKKQARELKRAVPTL